MVAVAFRYQCKHCKTEYNTFQKANDCEELIVNKQKCWEGDSIIIDVEKDTCQEALVLFCYVEKIHTGKSENSSASHEWRYIVRFKNREYVVKAVPVNNSNLVLYKTIPNLVFPLGYGRLFKERRYESEGRDLNGKKYVSDSESLNENLESGFYWLISRNKDIVIGYWDIATKRWYTSNKRSLDNRMEVTGLKMLSKCEVPF